MGMEKLRHLLDLVPFVDHASITLHYNSQGIITIGLLTICMITRVNAITYVVTGI